MSKTKPPRGRTASAAIRGDNGSALSVPLNDRFKQLVIRWAYVTRNRGHWSESDRYSIVQGLHKQLANLGYGAERLEPFAGCEIIQVELPYEQLDVQPDDPRRFHWAGWLMPWEFMIRSMLPASVAKRAPVIVRWLKGARPAQVDPQSAEKKVFAYVQAAPGGLAEHFDFSREHPRVRRCFEKYNWRGRDLIEPSVAKLASELLRIRPAAIHVTAVDAHQGRNILGEADHHFDDGVFLRDSDEDREVMIPAEEFAQLLANSDCRPQLVGLNLYHSSPRIAPHAVAAGAEAVVAFQDSIDDTLAELFFFDFYREWARRDRDLGKAFASAVLRVLRGTANVQGSGIVLWTARSLLTGKRRAKTVKYTDAEVEVLHPEDIDKSIPFEEQVLVIVEPKKNVNYSMLHNRRSMFDKLYFVNETGKRLDDVELTAHLFLGDHGEDQVVRLSIPPAGIDLRACLSFPLLSRQLRCFRESVMTTLRISVTWQNRTIASQTARVRVLPMNEWTDSDDDLQWLPSFVQPLDPAVGKVLCAAERHLRTLTRDPYAGFDGYQRVHANASIVDLQVEAIWNAIVYDFSLNYVNPPPTYTEKSQRIRSPSEVIESGRGTCLDLTILLASCLEHVDIHPLIVLLKGHAFPAYWRSIESRTAFWGTNKSALEEFIPADDRVETPRGRLDHQYEHFKWLLRPSGYDSAIRAIAKGMLVPFESVWLTTRKSFVDAKEAGAENLIDRSEFDCLIDIVTARHQDVLPLPERN